MQLVITSVNAVHSTLSSLDHFGVSLVNFAASRLTLQRILCLTDTVRADGSQAPGMIFLGQPAYARSLELLHQSFKPSKNVTSEMPCCDG